MGFIRDLRFSPKLETVGAYKRSRKSKERNRTQNRRSRRLSILQQLESRHLLAGELDASFGTAGIVTTDLHNNLTRYDAANAVAVDASGRMIAVGTTGIIARFTSSGGFDTAFNESDVSKFPGEAVGVAVQSDGKIVVAGTTSEGSTRIA